MNDNGKPTEATALAAPTCANPGADELATLQRLGDLLHRSGFARGARTKEQAVALVLMGREMGIPAMQALSTIHVIEGRPTAGVHVIGALLARGGVTWRVEEHTREACAIVFARPGWQAVTTRYTIDDARAAGLIGKANWRSYPRNMLYARAFTEGARIIAPDLCCGLMYTPEELAPDLAIDAETGEVATMEAHVNTADAQPPAPPEQAMPPARPPESLSTIMRAAFARMRDLGLDAAAQKELCVHVTGKASRRDCTRDDWQKVHRAIDDIEDEEPTRGREPGEEPEDERSDG